MCVLLVDFWNPVKHGYSWVLGEAGEVFVQGFVVGCQLGFESNDSVHYVCAYFIQGVVCCKSVCFSV